MTSDLANLLYQAWESQFGIIVQSDDAERLRQKLYAIRKNMPGMDSMSFVISPANGNDLWIIKHG